MNEFETVKHSDRNSERNGVHSDGNSERNSIHSHKVGDENDQNEANSIFKTPTRTLEEDSFRKKDEVGTLKSRLQSFRKHDTNIGKPFPSPGMETPKPKERTKDYPTSTHFRSPVQEQKYKNDSAIKLANKMLSPEKEEFNRFLDRDDEDKDPLLKYKHIND